MNTRMTTKALLITLLLSAGSAGAATLNQTFMNDFETNAIYLWSTDASNMSLDGISFGANMGAWQATTHTPAKLVLSGPTIGPVAGRFDLLMNYKNLPFQLEWAEVFFDNANNAIRGYGTLTFDGGGWSNANVSSHVIDIPLHPGAVVPLPSSLLLLVSIVLFVPVVHGRRSSTRAA